jgi:glycosyltransferase involved in cell wall biosynthesis
MRILFLDQSGKLGGAELLLLDIATFYRDRALVGLFEPGPFAQQLQARNIPTEILSTRSLTIRKDSSLLTGLKSLKQLLPLIQTVAQRSRNYDLIFANTQKAFVIGAIASLISRRPLVYFLQDILSTDHFSQTNLKLAVGLANRRAAIVIANSHATRDAFISAGGRADLVQVIYNGFDIAKYQHLAAMGRSQSQNWKTSLGLENHFVVGHFSRLSPWKGQHILIDALTHCPPSIAAVFVGDALFGEDTYAKQLQQQVIDQGLTDRVKFLGFRDDIPQLMASCDLIAHTSIAPEPFGRVIIEGMLCRTPVIAAAAGGAVELIKSGQTGWLTEPNNPIALAAQITAAFQSPDLCQQMIEAAWQSSHDRFDINQICAQIDQALTSIA